MQRPTGKMICEGWGMQSRPARDFEKCTNPDCWFTRQIEEHNRRWPSVPRRPDHCHPVF